MTNSSEIITTCHSYSQKTNRETLISGDCSVLTDLLIIQKFLLLNYSAQKCWIGKHIKKRKLPQHSIYDRKGTSVNLIRKLLCA